MSNHYSNHHLPLLILALCAVHCILDLGKEAARRAEKEAEERRQKEQEERG